MSDTEALALALRIFAIAGLFGLAVVTVQAYLDSRYGGGKGRGPR